MAYAFNPSTQKAEAVDLCEFEASLVYRASARTGSKATEKPCLEKPKRRRRRRRRRRRKEKRKGKALVSFRL